MATGATEGIPCAMELMPTGAWSYDLLGSLLNNYQQCPTKEVLIAAKNTQYVITIPTTYRSNQLVPFSMIRYSLNLGKYTFIIGNGSNLNTNHLLWDTNYSTAWRYSSSMPTLTQTQVMNNTYPLAVNSNITSTGVSGNTITLTPNFSMRKWPSGYIIYACTSGNSVYVIYSYIPSVHASSLNSGTDVTYTTQSNVNIINQQLWFAQ